MCLKLDLSGIILSLRIRNYQKTDKNDWAETWCKVDFSVVSDKWLDYHIDDDEVLLACEVARLADEIKALLDNRLSKPKIFKCMEPDFRFMLNPKKDLRKDPDVKFVQKGYEILDINMEWKISFWNDGLTSNYLSVQLGREELERMYEYLCLVTGRSKA